MLVEFINHLNQLNDYEIVFYSTTARLGLKRAERAEHELLLSEERKKSVFYVNEYLQNETFRRLSWKISSIENRERVDFLVW